MYNLHISRLYKVYACSFDTINTYTSVLSVLIGSIGKYMRVYVFKIQAKLAQLISRYRQKKRNLTMTDISTGLILSLSLLVQKQTRIRESLL
jgi:hypothetical protein